MQLEERIKQIVEQLYPIQLHDTPTKQKDCRIAIARKEGLRQLAAHQIRETVFKLISDNRASEPGTITRIVNDYLNHYIENHHDH